MREACLDLTSVSNSLTLAALRGIFSMGAKGKSGEAIEEVTIMQEGDDSGLDK